MVDSIVWGDPPESKRGAPSAWVPRLEPFMARPGEWGQVPGEFGAATATDLRKGTLRTPPGVWEFQTRQVRRGRVHLWARFVGPDIPPPDQAANQSRA